MYFLYTITSPSFIAHIYINLALLCKCTGWVPRQGWTNNNCTESDLTHNNILIANLPRVLENKKRRAKSNQSGPGMYQYDLIFYLNVQINKPKTKLLLSYVGYNFWMLDACDASKLWTLLMRYVVMWRPVTSSSPKSLWQWRHVRRKEPRFQCYLAIELGWRDLFSSGRLTGFQHAPPLSATYLPRESTVDFLVQKSPGDVTAIWPRIIRTGSVYLVYI